MDYLKYTPIYSDGINMLDAHWQSSLLKLSELYQGSCFYQEPNQICRELGRSVRLAWAEAFSCPPTQVHQYYNNAELLLRLRRLRAHVQGDRNIRKLQYLVAVEAGLSGEKLWIDALRVRLLTPQMRSIAEAEPVYYTHRDTWYANPIEQVNFWMPLHDVQSTESFQLFPDYFQKALANSSSEFDYGYFSNHIGWQSTDIAPSHLYPRSLESPNCNSLSIEGPADALWIFSAQHLHQSCCGQVLSRLSIDFRCLPLIDSSTKRPRNVDNASRGSTRNDFFCMTPSNLLA